MPPSDRNLTTYQSWALQRPKETLPWGKPPCCSPNRLHFLCHTKQALPSGAYLVCPTGGSFLNTCCGRGRACLHISTHPCSQVHPLTIHGPIHPSTQPHASLYPCANHPRTHHRSPQSPPPQLPPQPRPGRPASPQGSKAVTGGGSKPPVLSPPPSSRSAPRLSLGPQVSIPDASSATWSLRWTSRSGSPWLLGPTAPGSGLLCLLGPHVPQVLPPQLWCRPPDPQLEEHLSRIPHMHALCPGPRGALPSSSRAGGHPVPRRGFPLSALPMGKLRPGDGHGFLSAQGIMCSEVCSLARMGCGGCLRVWGAPGVTAPSGLSQEPPPMRLLTTCLSKPRSPSPGHHWGPALHLPDPGLGLAAVEAATEQSARAGAWGVRGPPHHPHTAPSCPLSHCPHPQGAGVTAPILWMRKLRLQVP